jgi:alpha-tubulin suppressor-like RCC1 family protein
VDPFTSASLGQTLAIGAATTNLAVDQADAFVGVESGSGACGLTDVGLSGTLTTRWTAPTAGCLTSILLGDDDNVYTLGSGAAAGTSQVSTFDRAGVQGGGITGLAGSPQEMMLRDGHLYVKTQTTLYRFDVSANNYAPTVPWPVRKHDNERTSAECLQSVCGGSCVNEQTDPNNCGGCGNVCTTSDPNASGSSCNGSGVCVTSCNAGFSLIAGSCEVDVTAISVGYDSGCALLSGGSVRCWGSNAYGQLGNGTTTNSSTPVAVSGLSGVTAISVSSAGNDGESPGSACALLSGGSVECWGLNSSGQLGNGTTTNSSTPVAVSGLNGATAIYVGDLFACALLSGGTVECWGDNESGQLGNGTTANSSTPVAVSDLSGVTAIYVGDQFACALVSGGSVECWGLNNGDQLGNGTGTNSSTPVAASYLSGLTVTAIAPGEFHVCALLSGGTVQCWGNNDWGDLGNGTETNSSTPVAVSGLSGVTAISTGDLFACALLSGGTVQCWGFNASGELGNSSTTGPQTCSSSEGSGACSTTPVAVTGLSGVTDVSVGYLSACALVSGGSVQCWGLNSSGQLGNGTTTSSDTPVPVVW